MVGGASEHPSFIMDFCRLQGVDPPKVSLVSSPQDGEIVVLLMGLWDRRLFIGWHSCLIPLGGSPSS